MIVVISCWTFDIPQIIRHNVGLNEGFDVSSGHVCSHVRFSRINMEMLN